MLPVSELMWLQAEELKEISKASLGKLKQSLLTNGFIQPFNVWHSPDKQYYILDGHHRKMALDDLVKEGKINLPEVLPCNIIYCQDRKEAMKFLLLYSSQYAHITPEGLDDLMESEGLDIDLLDTEIDLDSFGNDFDDDIDESDADYDAEDEIVDEPLKTVKLVHNDIIRLSNTLFDIELIFSLPNGKELKNGKDYEFVETVKKISKSMKGCKICLNGNPVQFTDVAEGF
jgi:hypothetical protein